jgi:hypothetical protein
MSDTEQREIAKTFIEPRQAREEIRDALKLEEERRAALVKNLYRLRALRLSRGGAACAFRKGEVALRSAQIHPSQ